MRDVYTGNNKRVCFVLFFRFRVLEFLCNLRFNYKDPCPCMKNSKYHIHHCVKIGGKIVCHLTKSQVHSGVTSAGGLKLANNIQFIYQ